MIDLLEAIQGDGVSLADLHPELPIRDQIEFGSMDVLDLVAGLRERHGVHVPEQDHPWLATLDGCVDYLLGLRGRHRVAGAED